MTNHETPDDAIPLPASFETPAAAASEVRGAAAASAATAAVTASETDLFGPLEPMGPRAGADSGQPTMAVRVLHEAGPLRVGIWECTPGGWAIDHRTNTETVHILAGQGRITDADGTVHELRPGVAVVLPLGWSGRWDITETLRKLYVTLEG